MIVLGLGSNIGGRMEYLESAINYLSESIIEIACISPVYESPALLKEDAPEDWNMPFLNIAIAGETNYSPQALLTEIKTIEKKVGRQHRGLWSPREIDIDILAYDAINIDEGNLKIPHSGLFERPFALLPLVDVAPNWRYPASGRYNGKTAYEIAQIVFAGENSTVKTSRKLKLQRIKLVA